ncbi:hypothetical protein [Endozoicomonas arenosclerae]|uniref:hypothetical protein n=1 Tax=Endozoicomonas arenosclerae TaxID=1633495 RepID=UPI000783DCA5|nr:hypothetical protein [Endozoicomonas arenosclerae]
MKPNTQTAMQVLIEQVRGAVPFDMPEAEICTGKCVGCPKKLLEFLDQELSDWEGRLEYDELPRLGDITRLAKTSKKVHKALAKNGLV